MALRVVQRLNKPPLGPFRSKAEADAALAKEKRHIQTPFCSHPITVLMFSNGEAANVCTRCEQHDHARDHEGWMEQRGQCPDCHGEIVTRKLCPGCCADLVKAKKPSEPTP